MEMPRRPWCGWLGTKGFSKAGHEEYSGERLVDIKNNKNVRILTPQKKSKPVPLSGTSPIERDWSC